MFNVLIVSGPVQLVLARKWNVSCRGQWIDASE